FSLFTGNFWGLNWWRVVLAFSTLNDRWLSWLPVTPPILHPPGGVERAIVWGWGSIVGFVSVAPTMNMLSSQQLMNSSFDPLHLVNTYGAFGSITRTRNEIV